MGRYLVTLVFPALLLCLYIVSSHTMRIMSWNVRGAMSSTICLSNLLDDTQCDVAIVTEHKLKDIQNVKMYLDSIHKNYFSIVKVDNNTDSTANNVCFIGKEGVAFLILKKPISCIQSKKHLVMNQIVSLVSRLKSQVVICIFLVYICLLTTILMLNICIS